MQSRRYNRGAVLGVLSLAGLALLVLVIGLVSVVVFKPSEASCPPFARERFSVVQVVDPTVEDDEWLLGCGFMPDVGHP